MVPPSSTAPPPELVEEVVQYVVQDPSEKRGLAACSLVCRHWASLTIPVLFRQVTLRSADDVAQFTSFLDAPPRVGVTLEDCVERLAVEYHGPQTLPWLHRLRFLCARLPWLLGHHTSIDNPSPCPIISSSFTLPRTLPSPCFSLLGNITLSNITLANQSSLIAFLDRLPDLHRILCKNIHFRDIATFTRRPHNLYWAGMQQCGDTSANAQLDLSLTVLEPWRHVGLADHVWSVLRKSAQAVLPQDYHYVHAKYRCVWDRADGLYQKIAFAFRASEDDSDRTLALEYHVDWRSHPAEQLQHILFVEAKLSKVELEQFPLLQDRLHAFEEALLGLDQVPHVRLVVQRDPSIFKHLLDAVLRGTVLPGLRAAQRLDLWHDGSAITTMAAIMCSQEVHRFNDSVVTLTPLERFDLLLSEAWPGGREGFLRSLLEMRQRGDIAKLPTT